MMIRAILTATVVPLVAVAPARAAERPNFLILQTDDQRLDTMGCYVADAPIKTPHIDSLAKRGIKFTNAFVSTPICAVSRASLVTGRYARNAQVHEFNTPIPPPIWEKSYPALMKAGGYFVGQIGKWGVGLGKHGRETFDFYDGNEDQGPPFREYQGELLHDSEWLTRRTRDFLDKVPPGTPFVFQVNYKAPHSSSEPAPEDLHTLDHIHFDRRPNETMASNARLPKHVQTGFGAHCYKREVNLNGDNNPYLRRYFEKIASVDRSVGAIMEELRKRGLLENTVVFFLSDHGAHFGEKLLGGKWTPFEESIRIPFIVADPSSPPSRQGASSPELVLNIDIAPTMLQLAGLPIPADMDGASLGPILAGEDPEWRDHFFLEHRTSNSRTARPIPRSIGIRGSHTKLFRWIDTDPDITVLHDLQSDPLEEQNLADDPRYAGERNRLETLLETWLAGNPDTYTYDSYGRRPQSGAPQIDWVKFREARPEEFAAIEAAIKDLNVTWDQAENDPEIREQISVAAKYWY